MPPHFQRHCQVTPALVLTQVQQDDLRRINQATLFGLRHLVKALLSIYLKENPQVQPSTLKHHE